MATSKTFSPGTAALPDSPVPLLVAAQLDAIQNAAISLTPDEVVDYLDLLHGEIDLLLTELGCV